MINWENIVYSYNNAEDDFKKINFVQNYFTIENVNDDFKNLREKLIKARDEVYEEYNLDSVNRVGYNLDLPFGIKLYEILKEEKYFNNRIASNDDIWRYLSVKIIPDIVHARWDKKEERFYKNSRRIWLKTIWWYIELSWRNNSEETFDILQHNTTDTILNLIERPGLGYNVELDREIMYQYSLIKDSDRSFFRSLLKLNLAKLPSFSPELSPGGIESYVRNLIKELEGE